MEEYLDVGDDAVLQALPNSASGGVALLPDSDSPYDQQGKLKHFHGESKLVSRYLVPGQKVASVSVKLLPKGKGNKQLAALLKKEAETLFRLGHPNILSVGAMTGKVTDSGSFLVVHEHTPNGKLDQFLLNRPPLNVVLLRKFALEIGEALIYLESQKIVHWDVAARNVYLSKQLGCKLGNFCQSKSLDDPSPAGYYTDSFGQMYMRWSAPEVGATEGSRRVIQAKEDAWGYGLFLYELFTQGKLPYGRGSWSSEKMYLLTMYEAQEGALLPQPESCPDEVYAVMMQCWETDPSLRATPKQIKAKLMSKRALDELRAILSGTKKPRSQPPSISSSGQFGGSTMTLQSNASGVSGYSQQPSYGQQQVGHPYISRPYLPPAPQPVEYRVDPRSSMLVQENAQLRADLESLRMMVMSMQNGMQQPMMPPPQPLQPTYTPLYPLQPLNPLPPLAPLPPLQPLSPQPTEFYDTSIPSSGMGVAEFESDDEDEDVEPIPGSLQDLKRQMVEREQAEKEAAKARETSRLLQQKRQEEQKQLEKQHYEQQRRLSEQQEQQKKIEQEKQRQVREATAQQQQTSRLSYTSSSPKRPVEKRDGLHVREQAEARVTALASKFGAKKKSVAILQDYPDDQASPAFAVVSKLQKQMGTENVASVKRKSFKISKSTSRPAVSNVAFSTLEDIMNTAPVDDPDAPMQCSFLGNCQCPKCR